MEKTKTKVFEICELKDSIMQWAREHKDTANVQVMGQVTDMIKDLADAEKNCWKACYYKSIVEAMKQAEEEEKLMSRMGAMGMDHSMNDRAGYDHWRYSSGRFAPAGRGHYSSAGFTPTYDDIGIAEMDWDFRNPRMGYTPSNSGSRGGSRGGSQSSSNSGRRSSGSGYDRYRSARMGFHQSGSQEDKEEMNEAAKEHMEEMFESFRDIMKDADPSLKKELKSHMTSFIGEMS